MNVREAPSIKVNDALELSMFRPEDGKDLVRYLNDRTIYENTCNIPFPYLEQDARQFIRDEYFFMDTHSKWRSLAVRFEGELIGGIGLLYNYGINSFKSEFGYWLARPFRGKGIMTDVVRRFSVYCLEELQLVRLEANVFLHNKESMSVLESAGFQREGLLRKAYEKDGKYIDSALYAIVRTDI